MGEELADGYKDDELEELKKRVLAEKGYFVPTLHEKYLKKDS